MRYHCVTRVTATVKNMFEGTCEALESRLQGLQEEGSGMSEQSVFTLYGLSIHSQRRLQMHE